MKNAEPIPADEASHALFSELAKWERHSLGHSPGYLNLSNSCLWFVPHARSILKRGLDIPVESIDRVERSDNLLWRGAVNIHLKQPLKIELEFFGEPDDFFHAIEEPVFHSDTLRVFLGFRRKKFLRLVKQLGLRTMEAES